MQDETTGMMFMEKAVRIQHIINEWVIEVEYMRNIYARCSDKDAWFWKCVVDVWEERKKDLEKVARKWKRLAGQCGGWKEVNTTHGIQAEDVKDVPIDEIMDRRGDKYGNRIKYKCPLHNEKTPSFVVYIQENRFKCYGCQAFGDVIDLYMALHEVEFKEAINLLSKMR